MKQFLKIAHRGAKAYAPENTLIAFEKAIEMGADGIELDVHLSSDGEIIVIHDATLDRTTNGKGEVKNLSLSELKTFKIENEHEIPSLREVFDLANRKCLINIELKVFETAKPVVDLIDNYVKEKGWLYDDFLISSFDWIALQEVRNLQPKVPIGVLTETDLDLALGFAEFIKAVAIHPYFHLLNAENTKQIHQKGFKVLAWTINEKEDIHKVKSFNVNGIISDFPDRL